MNWGEGEIWPIAPCTLLRLYLSLASCFTAMVPGRNNFCTISTSFKHCGFFFFPLILYTLTPNYSQGFNYHLYLDDSQICISSQISLLSSRPIYPALKEYLYPDASKASYILYAPSWITVFLPSPSPALEAQVLTTGWPWKSPGKASEHEHLWLAYYCLKQCVSSSVGVLLRMFILIPHLDARLGYTSKARALVQSLVGNLGSMYLEKWIYIYILAFFLKCPFIFLFPPVKCKLL